MILSDILGLSKHSHKKIWIDCDFKCHENCSGKRLMDLKTYNENLDRNNNKYICFYCSRHLKYSGNNNPNNKYNIDHNLFSTIDTEEKA